MVETILQNWIVSEYLLPFLLVFFILFAVLEKTGLLGKDQKQINALVSFVVSLIFVGAVLPKLIVGNLILVLTVSIVILFIGMLLWGFISGESKIEGKAVKSILAVVVVLVVVIAMLVITGVYKELFNFLFDQSWSKTFWTNISFLVIIAGALALVIMKGK